MQADAGRIRAQMSTNLRKSLSTLVGWLADRKVPRPLRATVYGTYARLTGADPSEAQLEMAAYPSLGAFFVRRLRPGLRPLAPEAEALLSPADGDLQAIGRVDAGSLLQAKGQSYSVAELLAGADQGVDLEGAWAVTVYLGPKDYHRVHTPSACQLSKVVWVAGERYSVAPKVVEKRRVYPINERAILRLETAQGPIFLVMVGALNVGRIRVLGVEQGQSPKAPMPFERGAELTRFEMGSTVVLILPKGGGVPLEGLSEGDSVRQGERIGSLGSFA